MKTLLILLLTPFMFLQALESDLLLGQEEPREILVNNRVLASVNGKPITVIDIMKRMDILFLKQFPEYTNSSGARYQFYMANWKRTLSELIDKELILADAAQSKMEVANGDVRQEMEELFGPNIILNLDKIGLSVDEATKIVSGDIAIRRMIYVKVTSKALGKVTPQATKAFYEEWVKENVKPTVITYQMLTVRDPNPERAEETAQQIYKKFEAGVDSPNELLKGLEGVKETISLSEVITQTDKEVAPQNREILLGTAVGKTSPPVKQISRAGNLIVWRLFKVNAKEEGGIPPYAEAEPLLKEELIDRAITEEQGVYINNLRRHYALQNSKVKEMLPDDFVPFTLK